MMARPPHLRTEVLQHVPRREFELNKPTFNKRLRSTRRGAARGPSGLTTEHLRPLLDDARALQLFFTVAQKDVPEAVVDLIRVERLTSLTKPDGAAWSQVTWCVDWSLGTPHNSSVRRWNRQGAPANTPCREPGANVAHAMQGLTELDPNATVTSVDQCFRHDFQAVNVGGPSSAASWKHRPPFRPLVLWAAVAVLVGVCWW